MSVTFLPRSFWQRLLGIPATPPPRDANGWQFGSGRLTVDLDRTPELTRSGGAVRFEGRNLPVRVLVVYAEDGTYRAFQNRCTHLGHRRLDYVPGTGTVQCCSVNKSTYCIDGDRIHGPAPRPISTYPVKVDGRRLHVQIG